MNSHEEYAALLDAFIDGELSEKEAEDARARLSDSDEYQAYVSDALAMRDWFPDVEETVVPDHFRESVLAALPPRKRSIWRTRWIRTALPIAACVTVVLLVQGIAGKRWLDAPESAMTTADAGSESAYAGSVLDGGMEEASEESALDGDTEEASEESALYSDMEEASEESALDGDTDGGAEETLTNGGALDDYAYRSIKQDDSAISAAYDGGDADMSPAPEPSGLTASDLSGGAASSASKNTASGGTGDTAPQDSELSGSGAASRKTSGVSASATEAADMTGGVLEATESGVSEVMETAEGAATEAADMTGGTVQAPKAPEVTKATEGGAVEVTETAEGGAAETAKNQSASNAQPLSRLDGAEKDAPVEESVEEESDSYYTTAREPDGTESVPDEGAPVTVCTLSEDAAPLLKAYSFASRTARGAWYILTADEFQSLCQDLVEYGSAFDVGVSEPDALPDGAPDTVSGGVYVFLPVSPGESGA